MKSLSWDKNGVMCCCYIPLSCLTIAALSIPKYSFSDQLIQDFAAVVCTGGKDSSLLFLSGWDIFLGKPTGAFLPKKTNQPTLFLSSNGLPGTVSMIRHRPNGVSLGVITHDDNNKNKK